MEKYSASIKCLLYNTPIDQKSNLYLWWKKIIYLAQTFGDTMLMGYFQSENVRCFAIFRLFSISDLPISFHMAPCLTMGLENNETPYCLNSLVFSYIIRKTNILKKETFFLVIRFYCWFIQKKINVKKQWF